MSSSHLRYLGLLLLEILTVLSVSPSAMGQTGGAYNLSWHTNDGGGTTSAVGGIYSLNGTIGQPDAGAASGGAYALSSGFWGIANLFPPSPLKILSIIRLPNGQAYLECLGVPNQVNNLQASPDLNPANFASVSPLPAAANSAGTFSYQDVSSAGQAKKFYRLAYP